MCANTGFFATSTKVLPCLSALVQERVKAGLRNARTKGKKLGRPRVDIDQSRVEPFERLEDPGARLPKRWELGSEQSTEPPNGAPKSAARDFRTPTQLRSLPDDALHITLLAAVNGDRAVSTGVTRVPKSPMIGVRRCLDLNGRKVSFGAFRKQVFLEGFQSEPLPELSAPQRVGERNRDFSPSDERSLNSRFRQVRTFNVQSNVFHPLYRHRRPFSNSSREPTALC